MGQPTANLPRLKLVLDIDDDPAISTGTEIDLEATDNTGLAETEEDDDNRDTPVIPGTKTSEISISTSLTIAQTLAAASKCAPTIIHTVDKTEISSFKQALYKILAKNFFGLALTIIDKPNSHNNPEATIHQLQTQAINCLYNILKADGCKLYIDSQTITELADTLRLCNWTNREEFVRTTATVRKRLDAEI